MYICNTSKDLKISKPALLLDNVLPTERRHGGGTWEVASTQQPEGHRPLRTPGDARDGAQKQATCNYELTFPTPSGYVIITMGND